MSVLKSISAKKNAIVITSLILVWIFSIFFTSTNERKKNPGREITVHEYKKLLEKKHLLGHCSEAVSEIGRTMEDDKVTTKEYANLLNAFSACKPDGNPHLKENLKKELKRGTFS